MGDGCKPLELSWSLRYFRHMVKLVVVIGHDLITTCRDWILWGITLSWSKSMVHPPENRGVKVGANPPGTPNMSPLLANPYWDGV